MGAGLSLVEQSRKILKTGVGLNVGSTWSCRLEEWLAAVLPPGADERYEDETPPDDLSDDETILEWTQRHRDGVHEWCFPTDELRAEYLRSIASRGEADVRALLRLFLFEESCFGADSEWLHQALYVHKDLSALDWLPAEFRRRLMAWMGNNTKPHPGIRWALDLLPHSPQQAIDAITGYLNVYRAIRPEGRSQGLLDAIAIIRARWIDDLTTGTEALFRLSPRELEALTAALYQKMGYTVELTRPSKDGGRDVIAIRQTPGQREVINIECKAHTSAVGVQYVRQLRGVIARHGANRGVLITISRFTRGARQEADNDWRLELIRGSALIQLLNANFGSLWIDDRAWICRDVH